MKRIIFSLVLCFVSLCSFGQAQVLDGNLTISYPCSYIQKGTSTGNYRTDIELGISEWFCKDSVKCVIKQTEFKNRSRKIEIYLEYANGHRFHYKSWSSRNFKGIAISKPINKEDDNLQGYVIGDDNYTYATLVVHQKTNYNYLFAYKEKW